MFLFNDLGESFRVTASFGALSALHIPGLRDIEVVFDKVGGNLQAARCNLSEDCQRWFDHPHYDEGVRRLVGSLRCVGLTKLAHRNPDPALRQAHQHWCRLYPFWAHVKPQAIRVDRKTAARVQRERRAGQTKAVTFDGPRRR